VVVAAAAAARRKIPPTAVATASGCRTVKKEAGARKR